MKTLKVKFVPIKKNIGQIPKMFLKDWIKALKTSKQLTGYLYAPYKGMCCLGVAEKIRGTKPKLMEGLSTPGDLVKELKHDWENHIPISKIPLIKVNRKGDTKLLENLSLAKMHVPKAYRGMVGKFPYRGLPEEDGRGWTEMLGHLRELSPVELNDTYLTHVQISELLSGETITLEVTIDD